MMTTARLGPAIAGMTGAVLVAQGCRESRAAEPAVAADARHGARDGAVGAAVQPLPIAGDSTPRFILHREHIRPGQAAPRGVTLKNPYAGNAAAVATGAKLF